MQVVKILICSVLGFNQNCKSYKLSRKSYNLSCITLNRHSSKELAGNIYTTYFFRLFSE